MRIPFEGDGGAGNGLALFVDHLSFEGMRLAHGEQGTKEGQEKKFSHCFLFRRLKNQFTGSRVHGFTS